MVQLCIMMNVVADVHRYDELLDRTAYAQLLKELIGINDLIGLLKHQIDADERRFIKDCILGKTVRAMHAFALIESGYVSAEDIDYLYYWLDLAMHEENLDPVLVFELTALKKKLDMICVYAE